ncbi:ATP-binding protein [Candidatus Nitrospira allomarina]|jgi:signal transduction histidine kinase|uniref:histidine kinase n=1 Tax=Candidatus Nitrospira allomarina TaxID=3020900 RepID=A0AA96GDJ2_9BACT|nr:ATP-binding protein [Candidatus Nitrospira allomarina]WNM59137.1 ATP-binding protein [Candidatus Nitrospira allomarina]
MSNRLESTLATKQQSTLQKILTSVVNEVGMEAVLVAIMTHDGGPLVEQVSRGFSPREVRAILRALSMEDLKSLAVRNGGGGELESVLRIRMVTPGSKVALVLPLKFGGRVYGTLVLARRENSALTKREKTTLSTNVSHISTELKKAGLFGSSLILSKPVVGNEPLAMGVAGEEGPAPVARTYSNAEVQERIGSILTEEVNGGLSFDRGWVSIYDPLAATLEVLGVFGTQKKDVSPGQLLSLDDSASGWSVRHRKPRCDNNLASTQGRFHDYKQLYRDRFASTIVVPFYVRGRVAGTVTLASKNPNNFDQIGTESKSLEAISTKLVELFEDPSCHLSVMEVAPIQPEQPALKGQVITAQPEGGDVRKEERRAALHEVSSFLATEIREPIGFIRAQLEEITTDADLDFDSQTRVENAMRDMIRIETVLNEILDFAKPLELDRKMCRVQDLLDKAFSLVSTDIRVNRIEVLKKVPARLAQVRWDEVKMQHVFLCIFKNAIEAMSPGGHLRVEVMLTRARKPELQIIIANDGVPIPAEFVDKVFEPYFTTKRSGTGLGLATVKKVVEEHQGQISIASEPEKGTTVTILMPAPRPRTPYRPRRPA